MPATAGIAADTYPQSAATRLTRRLRGSRWEANAALSAPGLHPEEAWVEALASGTVQSRLWQLETWALADTVVADVVITDLGKDGMVIADVALKRKTTNGSPMR